MQEHTHTTCNNWEQYILNQSFTNKKQKRFTWESLIVDLLFTKLLLLLDTTFSCLLVALPSILPPFTTLLTTLTVPTPRFSCFHKRTNPYFLFLGLTKTPF